MLHRLPIATQRALARAAVRLPASIQLALLGGRRMTYGGATLDLRANFILALAHKSGRPAMEALSPDDARREFRLQAPLFAPAARPMHSVADRKIPGPAGPLPVRIYRPARGTLPVLVYFHGGGWVVGDLETHDAVCRVLADEARALLIAVDYRLAPEHKFPAAADDAFAAFRWVVANAASQGGDPARVAVGGDSAGGNLAAVVSHRALDEGGPLPVAQLLLYPALDHRRLGNESYRVLGARKVFLTHELLEWFGRQYRTTDANVMSARYSPALRDDLHGLPPAYLLTAGFDPLRDEGHAYARRLTEAGVETTLRCHEDMFHGFLALGAVLPQGLLALEEAATFLRDTFAAH